MKRILKFLLLSLPVLFLASCEDVVQIKLDEGSKLYVVDAFVNSLHSEQTIRVTTNDSYFSGKDAPPVPNAIVVLKDLTANVQYNFSYTSNGNYVYTPGTTDSLGRVGHQYELNVTIDGDIYTALTIEKRTAVIDSLSSSQDLGSASGFGGPSNFDEKSPYYCFLWARDKVDDDPDYYWIKTFRNDTSLFGPNDINLCIDGTGGPVSSAIGLDTADFTPPATFLGFNEYAKNAVCRAEVHSVSRETYYFLIQASAQINNGGLFATTPENVKTNIVTPTGAKTKAVGWFNMATVATKTKIVQ